MESKYKERLLAYLTGDHIYIDTENCNDGTFDYCGFPANKCIRGGQWMEVIAAVFDPQGNRNYPLELTVVDNGHADEDSYVIRVKYINYGMWRKRSDGIGVVEVK